MQIARNKRADWYRNKCGPGISLRPDVECDSSLGSTEYADAHSDGQDLVDAVQRAMRQLSVDDQEIISLRHFQPANSYAEIAVISHMSEGAARVRCHRAIARLELLLRSLPAVSAWLDRAHLQDHHNG